MRIFRLAALIAVFFCVISFIGGTAETAELEYDVVVAGGGAGGVAAALQAARMGSRVIMLEESSWLGGQMTAAGVSTMDDLSNQKSGIYLEFINSIEKFYSEKKKSHRIGYFGSRTVSFEPHVGQNKLFELIENARIAGATLDIQFHTPIKRVIREGDKIIGVETDSNTIKCKVLIDATEYGDIIPLSGAPYRAGHSASPNINPEAMIQDITWTAVIKHYPNGVPPHLVAPAPLANYKEEHRRNYTRYLTADGGDNPWRTPQNLATHNAYRAIPDSSKPGYYDGEKVNWGKITKTGVNMGNDYPGRIGWAKGRSGLPVKYLDDRELRRTVNRRALLKTLNFIYYLQNEIGEAGKKWSIADDEYYSEEALDLARDLIPPEWHEIVRRMPVIPYVRESRRILGEKTLDSNMLFKNSLSYRDGKTNLEFADAIAIGKYTLDLHNSGEPADIETELGESVSSIERNNPRGNFQVPLYALVPKQIDGLIAAEKNLSMSRIAAGALRLQPICMMTGQAAGALAAISVKKNLPPREIEPILVQWEILNSGADISLAKYRDVPRGHKYNAAVQLSNVLGLLPPLAFPHNPSHNKRDDDNRNLGVPLVKGPNVGTFGVDRPLSDADRKRIASVAPSGFALPSDKTLTRGEAVDMLVRALVGDRR